MGSGMGGSSGRTYGSSSSGAGAPVMDQAKETLSNVAGQVGNKVASGIDAQKDRAADGLGSVAQALRQSSDQMRDQNQGSNVHELISSAAAQVDRLSGYLRSTDTRQMINGVERFAREQPAVFLGGAFLLGLLGARFLKSSGQSSSQRYDSTYGGYSDYGTDEDTGGASFSQREQATGSSGYRPGTQMRRPEESF